MGSVKHQLIYLAGPIDGVDRGQALDWRDYAAAHLVAHGVSVFSPAHAFSVSERASARVCEVVTTINDTAIINADAMIAMLTSQSFGTPLEVKLAATTGIPVYGIGMHKRSIYRELLFEKHFHRLHSALEFITGVAPAIPSPGPV